MRHMAELLDSKELNIKTQYELQEFRQLNYETFIHDFARISVNFLHYNFLNTILNKF
jgi:hypothetical protein